MPHSITTTHSEHIINNEQNKIMFPTTLPSGICQRSFIHEKKQRGRGNQARRDNATLVIQHTAQARRHGANTGDTVQARSKVQILEI
jgi:hypothetical protein